MLHDADATVLCCRRRVVGLGEGIDSQEMVEGTISTSFGLCQRLEFLRTTGSVDIVEYQVHAQNIAVHVLIQVVVGKERTVGLLVEGEVDAIERCTLIAHDGRLLAPQLVGEEGKCHGMIATHGVYDQLIVLIGRVDGNGSLGGNVDVLIAGGG